MSKKRWKRLSDIPAGGRKRSVPILERFLQKISFEDDCWIWTAFLDSDGYGRIQTACWGNKIPWRAHRVSYFLFRGPIPKKMVIDHICRKRNCVNPWHLRIVTVKENSLVNSKSVAAVNSKKTFCKSGHKFSAANTYLEKKGERKCKECRRAIVQRRRAARKAARLESASKLSLLDSQNPFVPSLEAATL
jgi:hypothetical protein